MKIPTLSKLAIVFMLGLFLSEKAITQSDVVVYDNEIYVDYIAGLSFHITDLPTSLPILDLGSSSLTLSFDDMGGSFYDYTYEIVHCDKDWNKSEINELEFLDGFNGELIENFTASENTYVDYTHYSLTIPNNEVRMKASGNYVLIIYDEDKLPIITRRFIVVQPRVLVESEFRKNQLIENLNTHHAIYFQVIDREGYLSNPTEELYVTIMQNGRWDTAISNIRGQSVLGERISFNLERPFSFPAYKEFRNFDIRNLETVTRNVHSLDLTNEGTKAILEVSKNRKYGNYIFENDANGLFVHDNQNDRRWSGIPIPPNNYRGAITGDYVDVYFTLKTMEIYDEDVYLLGGFSDWKIRPDYKMEYDNEKKVYRANSFFKQGYYDYYYVSVNKDNEINFDVLEGSHRNTENDYTIIVYQRAYGSNYDQIIAINQINTQTN